MTETDTYFQHSPSWAERARTGLALRFALRGCRLRPDEGQQWTFSRRQLADGAKLLAPSDGPSATHWDARRDVVVSTVRMGYGHHRIALGIASHGEAHGRTAKVLDLLASPRDEAKAIRRMDAIYSLMSRLSADMGGPVERFWGRLMRSGGLGALRLTHMMATRLTGLLSSVPRDVPFISAYPLNGHMAVRLGFTRVVNIVFDNDPQHFLVVPRALNLVQSASAYERLRRMGVPREEVAVAGHWVGRDLLAALDDDCAARIRRAERGAPRRLLVSIGGAGAQQKFVSELVAALRPLLWSGRVRVMLNLGDHRHLRGPFSKLAGTLGVDGEHVHGADALDRFCRDHPLDERGDRGLVPLTLFSTDEHLEAVRTTDWLLRICDVLVTKPSELAFVPVPKLHIRRVGDHEAASATRSSELGDGTAECRTIEEAVSMITLLCQSPEFLRPMNERIRQNARLGIYDGASQALQLAISHQATRRSPCPTDTAPRAA
jgi:hypothetical protein